MFGVTVLSRGEEDDARLALCEYLILLDTSVPMMMRNNPMLPSEGDQEITLFTERCNWYLHKGSECNNEEGHWTGGKEDKQQKKERLLPALSLGLAVINIRCTR